MTATAAALKTPDVAHEHRGDLYRDDEDKLETVARIRAHLRDVLPDMEASVRLVRIPASRFVRVSITRSGTADLSDRDAGFAAKRRVGAELARFIRHDWAPLRGVHNGSLGTDVAIDPSLRAAASDDVPEVKPLVSFRVDEPSGKSSVHARFGALVIPRALLELDRRRIGPTSLIKRDYHRLHWMNLLLPHCAESLEPLVDTCPSCEIKLGWRFAQGIGNCDHCGEAVPPSEAPHLPGRLADGYRLFASLSSPDAASVAKAWSGLPDPLRTVDPQGLVNLALQLGTIATGATPKPPSRFSLATMTDEGLAESVAVGAEFLRTFPFGLRDWIREADEGFADDIEATARLRTRLRFLIGRFAYPGVPALIEQALPNIARYASHGLVTTKRYYLYTEARRRLGFDNVQMARFKAHPDLVARHISAPAKRQLIQYDADYIDELTAIVRGATTARSAAEAMRLPIYGVEQLCLDGLLDVEDHFVARVAIDELRIRAAGVSDLMDRIRAASAAGPAPAACRPLPLAADRIGGGLKPWSGILAALVGGALPFWMTGPASDLSNVLVRPSDLAPFRRAPVEFRKLPGGLSQDLTQRDAAEILNVKPSHLLLLVDELGHGADRKSRTPRSSVVALASRVAWPGEIAWHIGVAPQKIRRLMLAEGIVPAATGWDRAQLRDSGLLPR